MTELLQFLGTIQSSGGVLVGIFWMVLEVRRTRKDFNTHRHDDEGQVIVPLSHD
jgi:hypothetical protein